MLFQAPLWPVTVEAIKATQPNRHEPILPRFNGLLFLTRCGNAWVRDYVEESRDKIGRVAPNDEVGKAFNRLEKAMNIAMAQDGFIAENKRRGLSFYAFRRTFTTIANDTMDKDAVRRIQGQELTGMDPHYIKAIPRERLQAVVNYVHRKLFECDPHELSLSNLIEKLQR